MSLVKSFSVGSGDMFYIKHNSDNFTIIDCCMDDIDKTSIVRELNKEYLYKSIRRFISTHPDHDHVKGLKYLDDNMKILNFYCVKNSVTKEDVTQDFQRYCQLRDSQKAFFLRKGCRRKWMNESNEERVSSGINILWPDVNNQYYADILLKAKNRDSPNNLSLLLDILYRMGLLSCGLVI